MFAYTRRTIDKMLTWETTRPVSTPLVIMKIWYQREKDKSTPKEKRTSWWSLEAETSFLLRPICTAIWFLQLRLKESQEKMSLELMLTSSTQIQCNGRAAPQWTPMLREEWRKILVKLQWTTTQVSQTMKSSNTDKRPCRDASVALAWVTLWLTLTQIWEKTWWSKKILTNPKCYLKLPKKGKKIGKQSHKRLGFNQKIRD